MSSQTASEDEIRKILQPIIWDYNIDPSDFYAIASGKKQIAGIRRESVLIRMLERLFWYDLLKLFGTDGMAELLTPGLIAGLRIKEQREKYELARKVLQGESVSFSGWSPEYREKIRHTLLSDRWYRTEQGIF